MSMDRSESAPSCMYSGTISMFLSGRFKSEEGDAQKFHALVADVAAIMPKVEFDAQAGTFIDIMNDAPIDVRREHYINSFHAANTKETDKVVRMGRREEGFIAIAAFAGIAKATEDFSKHCEKLKTTDKVLSVAVGCLKSGLDAKIKLIQDYWGKNGKKASNQNWQNQIEEINKNFGKGSKKGLGQGMVCTCTVERKKDDWRVKAKMNLFEIKGNQDSCTCSSDKSCQKKTRFKICTPDGIKCKVLGIGSDTPGIEEFMLERYKRELESAFRIDEPGYSDEDCKAAANVMVDKDRDRPNKKTGIDRAAIERIFGETLDEVRRGADGQNSLTLSKFFQGYIMLESGRIEPCERKNPKPLVIMLLCMLKRNRAFRFMAARLNFAIRKVAAWRRQLNTNRLILNLDKK